MCPRQTACRYVCGTALRVELHPSQKIPGTRHLFPVPLCIGTNPGTIWQSGAPRGRQECKAGCTCPPPLPPVFFFFLCFWPHRSLLCGELHMALLRFFLPPPALKSGNGVGNKRHRLCEKQQQTRYILHTTMRNPYQNIHCVGFCKYACK